MASAFESIYNSSIWKASPRASVFFLPFLSILWIVIYEAKCIIPHLYVIIDIVIQLFHMWCPSPTGLGLFSTSLWSIIHLILQIRSDTLSIAPQMASAWVLIHTQFGQTFSTVLFFGGKNTPPQCGSNFWGLWVKMERWFRRWSRDHLDAGSQVWAWYKLLGFRAKAALLGCLASPAPLISL